MKKNLEILEIEAKLTKDEKNYWRVKTLNVNVSAESSQWMSVFDVVVKDALVEMRNTGAGKMIACCEVIEKKGTNFRGEDTIYYNITKCYGEADTTLAGSGSELQVDEKPEVVKPGEVTKSKQNVTNGNGSMYASYAKDVFCALVPATGDASERIDLMELSISLVKQAKEAFESK